MICILFLISPLVDVVNIIAVIYVFGVFNYAPFQSSSSNSP